MSRYDSAEWKELVSIQNGMWHVDILTITGFMNHEQFIRHLEHYRAIAKECRAAYDDCDDTDAENEYLGSLDYEARFY